jgi:hypothetical protein
MALINGEMKIAINSIMVRDRGEVGLEFNISLRKKSGMIFFIEIIFSATIATVG